MFKKLAICAAATLAASGAFAQSSVSLYGRFDTALQVQNNQATGAPISSVNTGSPSRTKIDSGAISGSRFGFRGSEDLGGGTAAIFTLEGGFNPGTGRSGQGGALFGRQAFVGAKSGWGQVTLGRQYSTMFDHFGTFDAFGISNADNTAFYASYDAGGLRVNNSIRYGYSGGGIDASLMYGTGGVAGSTSAQSFVGFGVAYAAGPLGVGFAYDTKNLNNQAGTNNFKTTNTMFGASYAFGPAKVLGNYMVTNTNTAANPKSNLFSLGGTFDLSPQVGLTAAYYNDKTNVNGGQTGKRNTFGLQATYSLSKRTLVYGYADTTKISGAYSGTSSTTPNGVADAAGVWSASNGASGQNTFMLGLRHSF